MAVNFRCGMVSIVGRPNVGKSTLLNRLVGQKIAIVTDVPQTTRQQIRGIYNDERGQIVFIDTPGLHAGRDKLAQMMQQSAYNMTADVDCVIHLVDSSEHVGKEEEQIVERLKHVSLPIILGLNKVDMKGKYIPEYIELWERTKGKSVNEFEKFVLMPLSGKTGTNIEKLYDTIFDFLPEGPALYPTDTVTDTPQKMAIADIIREKLFLLMREEVPHAIAVVVEAIEPRRGKTLHIRAVVLVERDSQKAMVIGKNGEVLKQAGTLAREELEVLLDQKVFLELFVKTQPEWRNDASILQEMGY
ncbi:MAG: GTPase Era [Candidatus Omnitrophica bacterium]|nr:GTPase Era [Candidatus Omnitrophota bacterium]